MTYNFTDEPTPELKTQITATGTGVYLEEGSTQGDQLTAEFSGQTIQVSIVPPEGWVLSEVSWEGGATGTFSVPPAGEEETHGFSYTVSQVGAGSFTDTGAFKIKKTAEPD